MSLDRGLRMKLSRELSMNLNWRHHVKHNATKKATSNTTSNAIKLIAACALSITVTGLIAQTITQSTPPPAPVQTVPSLDTARYMGTWYEIARFPNPFQNQCVGKVAAAYKTLADGKIEVANSCDLANGQRELAVGEAKPGTAGVNTQLRVSFLPKLIRWLPIGWGDYWVVDLASDYRYAAVGDPERKYLWLLSRTPTLAPADRQAMEAKLQAQSFDTRKLVNTPQ